MQTKRILASVGTTGAIILGALLGPAAALAHTNKAKPCVAPRVTGDRLPVARRRLDRAGCRVGRVHRPKVASGVMVVRRQSVRPGRRLRHGARVGLWLRVKPGRVGVAAPTTTTTTTTPAGPVAPVVSTTAPSPSVPVPVVHASIDPTFTQDPTDPLHVTWTYDAGVSVGSTLPVGVLALSVTPATGGLGPVGGCQMNVGGAVSGGTCTVELPQFGSYSVTVTYTGSGGSVGPATQTEVDDVEPLPVTVPLATATSVTVDSSDAPTYVLNASVSDANGPVSTGTIKFASTTLIQIGSPQFYPPVPIWTATTETQGQTSCTLTATSSPVTLSSPDCSIQTPGMFQGVSTLDGTDFVATFMGAGTDLSSVSAPVQYP